MGSHPANLAFRFILEIVALISVGFWGFRATETWPRYLLAVGLPVGFAILWTVFAVPDDPSRSGGAPVAIPGILRLMLELFVFGSAVWALFMIEARTAAWLLAGAVALHYALSYDRIARLVSR